MEIKWAVNIGSICTLFRTPSLKPRYGIGPINSDLYRIDCCHALLVHTPTKYRLEKTLRLSHFSPIGGYFCPVRRFLHNGWVQIFIEASLVNHSFLYATNKSSESTGFHPKTRLLWGRDSFYAWFGVRSGFGERLLSQMWLAREHTNR